LGWQEFTPHHRRSQNIFSPEAPLGRLTGAHQEERLFELFNARSKAPLLRRLFAHEHVTRLYNGGGIDGDVAFVNVTNDAFFIDEEGGPISKPLLFVEDTIVLNDSAFEIAQDWERDFNLPGKLAVGGNTVNTHTENLSVG
jgi:hypothetical protein